MRYFLGCLCLVALCLPGLAQDQDGPIRMTIYPAPAPEPALRYRLYPSEADRTPGNAALTYYRCLSPDWFIARRHPGLAQKVANALAAPLNKMPNDLNSALSSGDLKELDRAARQEYCAWEFLERVRRAGFELVLPELQAFRQLGMCLALRARFQFAAGHPDASLYSLQSAFSLGHDMGHAPLAINALVGIAISQLALDQVRDFVQQPGAPNLYWALATIPRPTADWPRIMEGEQLCLYAAAPLLRDIEKKQLSPGDFENFNQQMLKLVSFGSQSSGSEDRLGLTYLVLKQYPEARRALIAQGRRPEEVDVMPTLQVWAIHALGQFRRLQDDQLKWFYLPAASVEGGLAKADEEFKIGFRRLEGAPFSHALPAYSRLHSASLRIDRQIALLQVVEAIRLHAAVHGGLPASLDAISEVPVPRDPATDGAFGYKVEGEKAILTAPQIQPAPLRALVYELTLKK